MADQLTLTGVPGVGPDGQITPFSPNPAWIGINPWAFPPLPEYPFFTAAVADYPESPVKYYQDVFGNVHLSGVIEVVGLLSTQVWTPIIDLTATDTSIRPDRNRYYTTNVSSSLGAGNGIFASGWIRVTKTGTETTIWVYFGSSLTATVPIGSRIPIDMVWETY